MVDSLAKNMGGLAVGIGSIGLVGESMKMLPRDMMRTPKQRPMSRKPGKMFQPRPMKPMKFDSRKQSGNMIRGTTNLMVGTALLGATAGMVNKL